MTAVSLLACFHVIELEKDNAWGKPICDLLLFSTSSRVNKLLSLCHDQVLGQPMAAIPSATSRECELGQQVRQLQEQVRQLQEQVRQLAVKDCADRPWYPPVMHKVGTDASTPLLHAHNITACDDVQFIVYQR